ncbi:uncharacterized protein LOC135342412 [Halichondria panicea]|uniref:uncharacterized protein LOC135342412 n=1 Tax=Halichondria panicea TaxID=6063 RepID=UPI00312B9F53
MPKKATKESFSMKPVSKLTSGEVTELMKPLIFGDHQKHFRLFSWAVGLGIVYYMVFRHNFGEKPHCFTKIRDWRDKRWNNFFSVSPEELQRIRQQRTNETVNDKTQKR